jgi:phospholipid transport system substrate-binding protein
MTRTTFAFLAAFLVAAAAPALAGPPTDAVRGGVDRALKVLEDPVLKGEAHTAERRKQLREIANGLFDFEEMSQRALATHWRERTPEERQKFVGLFADLLENTYFAQIDTYSGGGSVRYGAETVQGDQATVRTTVVTAKGTEIPLDYRLLQKNGRWWVYDVSIEGVSLVNNYRAQFNQIIRTSSYQQLVQRLEKKAIPAPKPSSAGG